jgi:hypothetical protein
MREWLTSGVLLACVMVWCPAWAETQPLDAAPQPSDFSLPCPPPTVPASSNPIVRGLVTEWARLGQDWCKVVRWDDPWASLQDLTVDVFTGSGIHPTGGIVAPGGGAAGGLALNVDWNVSAPADPRFLASVEGRGSEHGFWEIGGKLQTLFAGYSYGGQAPHFTLLATHLDLPGLSFYGLGNETASHRTVFGLRDTALELRLDAPAPFGFTLSAELAGLWFAPDVSASLLRVNDEATAPGLHANTTYLRPRVSVAWSYPSSRALYGFSTSAVVSYGFYETMAGGDHSFDRLDAQWNAGLALSPRAGAVSFLARLVVSDPHTRSTIPFYLQPTLGGGDINDENFLRGYPNYRFRAPNQMVYELSYERRIIDPLGLRLFGELGRVGLRPSELGFDRLKSSVGFGITFRLGGAAVAELSFGWSGSEGMHVYSTGNTNNVGGVTAGLRGVF